jgi:hypothetical protein
MDCCTIKPLYLSNRKDYNIVSTVLFNMKSCYKNFNKYLYGIENWLKLINDQLSTFYLRVYIDDSIIKNDKFYESIKKIDEKNKKLQLVYFNCNKFKNGDYHKELFPTLIRFLPLFKYPNNDTNYVLIRDLDVDKYNKNIKLLFSNYVEKFSKIKKSSGIIMNLIGYEPDHIKDVKNKWGFNIMAPALSTNIKLSITILKNYINKLDRNNKNNILKYGVDEIFLNDVLLDFYIPYKNQIAVITPSYSFYYIKNSLSKSLHYSKYDNESKEAIKCKNIDQLINFMNKNKSIIKDKYRKQIENYNPNNIITNYYL